MLDEHGRTRVPRRRQQRRSLAKNDCAFRAPDSFALSFSTGNVRYCQSWDEVQTACHLLDGVVKDIRIERDGYCLDGNSALIGDASTPDVIDGEWWLGLRQSEGEG